jgi:DNA-binding CsgD family transcriptional regulator
MSGRRPALRVASCGSRDILTPRETECLEWLGRGLNNEDEP